MERGRYIRYSKRSLPKRKRTIRVEGSFEDSGKYLRCWNCGFIVNVDRDLGSPEQDGNYQTVVEPIPNPNIKGTGDKKLLTLTNDSIDMVGTIIVLGADGEPVNEYRRTYEALVSHGCPLCGVANLL